MKDHLFDVIVRAESPDHYSAQAVSFPDLKAEAPTETEAIDKVREALTEFLAKSKRVKVSVKSDNPWLDLVGSAADDPDFEQYLEYIRQFRESVDQE
jgi:hypothetical protein